MKRVKWLLLLMLLACCGAFAQNIGVTVGLSQAGPIFYVDGQIYSGTQQFFWPVGSIHTLQFPFSVAQGGGQLPYQSDNQETVEWFFGGWTDNLGVIVPTGSPSLTVTVQSGLTSIIGTITTDYLLTITFPNNTGSGGSNTNCSGGPGLPPVGATGWGLIYVNGTCYSDSLSLYVPAGVVTLNAFPFPGYAFAGFASGGNPPTPAFSTFNMTTATQISAVFAQAKRVVFATNPLGLQVTVDHTNITTSTNPQTPGVTLNTGSPTCTPAYNSLPPGGSTYGGYVLCAGEYDFLPTSSHVIGAPSPQQDNQNNWWVFNGFNDGLGQNGVYAADADVGQAAEVIANFLPGMPSDIVTVPAGLKIVIDGTSAYTNYNFVWAQGSTHTLAAPAMETDAAGRTWQFVSWSNGGSATQSVTVPSSGSVFGLTAVYTELGQVQVTSTPSGLTFTVGASTCTTPCAVSQASGTQLQISAPATVAVTSNTELIFSSWSSGGSTPSIQATFTQGAQTFNATYQTAYALAVSSNPANAATVRTSPASANGYYPAGTQITLTPMVNSGYKFLGWGGDLSGAATPGFLTMSAPHSVILYTAAVPTIAPAGIMNAAGPTPDGSVSPGSIISIYGQNLSTTTQIGPTNPLAQAIGNVTVTVNNILMPLIFVSPGQINAQVPVELAPGTYTVTVQQVGQPPVAGSFIVNRNAPGIFVIPNEQNLPMGAALHQDGTLITMSSPARRNEIVSFYGTGFGPLNQAVVDGFPAPLTPLDPVADNVSLSAGGVTVPAAWTGAAPTLVGTDIVQMQIVDSIPSSTTINVVVNVNGVPSAIVQLPVE